MGKDTERHQIPKRGSRYDKTGLTKSEWVLQEIDANCHADWQVDLVTLTRKNVLGKLAEEPVVLPGAPEFLEWLKPNLPRTSMLTDTFEEYSR